MLKRKWGKITIAAVAVIVLIGVAIIFSMSSSGWERYTKNDDYVIVDGYKTVIEEGKKEGLDDDQIWTKVVSFAEVAKYPQKELDALKQRNLADYEDLAKSAGYDTLQEFLDKEMSLTEAQFDENSENFCKNEIAEKLVLYRIAALENISVDKQEYEQYLTQLMEINGFTEESFKEAYGCTFSEYAEENGMEETYLREQVENQIFQE